jgi:nucleoid-associated protein YgaU
MATESDTKANAVVKELDTALVERGDSLWRISRKVYGRGTRYTQIYEANAVQIRNPDLIYPGQIFVVPSSVAN